MLITETGIVNEPVKPLQLLNAYSPMLVTESGITKFPVNPLQFLNTDFPILVTDVGISISFIDMQFSNTP